ncbi:unnamed protein product [Paramecium sonneborni]|uniref:Uncharacterized protein n=1 Tax=Paramecium sonneborni TaxID=65129 RepID=A0A8S1LLV2_9CILI|nr:unnamed protein product [Paramecium sonneborni]
MQKRQSHNKVPSEDIHSNNYYIMPKSLRSSQTSADNLLVQKVVSTNNIDQFEQICNTEKLQNQHQQDNAYQSNMELQQAIHYSEQNNQFLIHQHQQLLQNNLDLQSLYNRSKMENKKLSNELTLLQNRISLRINELKQAQENGAHYTKEIAQLKISIQKLNSTVSKLIEDNSKYKDQLNATENQSFLLDKGLSSRRDLNQQNDLKLNGSNSQIKSTITNDNIQKYQNQVLKYQKELTEKNQLITGLQQQVKNLTEFQRQLMSKSQKIQHHKGLKDQLQLSPFQTPIQKLCISNESQIMSNKNLLNLIDEEQKPDSQFQRTRQSDEFDVKYL